MTVEISQIRRVLIVQTAFIGDVILTLPLAQVAARIFGDATIDFLTIPTSKNIVETHRDISQLWIYDKRGKDRGWRNYLALAKQLRDQRYDLAIIPHRSMRSAALAWLARIPNRIGFHRSAGRMLLTDVLPYPYGIHEIERNLHLLKPFGVSPSLGELPSLNFSEKDVANVQNWLSSQQMTGKKPFIALAPGSVWATKRWLPEYFATLAERLHTSGFQPLLIGGPGDVATAETVIRAAKCDILNAVAKLSLRESAELISRCAMLITNDSAPMHMGVAVRTPVLAVFGPTVQKFGFYPVGKLDKVAEIEDLECRPCGRHGSDACPIGTFACMKTLLPERVFSLAQEILDNARDSG